MGGKQKKLTQARRKTLQKEMTDALVAGTFRLAEGQSLDSVLDEIDDGIKNDRYPIEVDLPSLLAIWSGIPAPEEAQTAAGSEQGAPPAAEFTSQGGYEIVGQTDVEVEQLAPIGVGPAAVPGTVEHAQAQAAGASPTAQAVLGTGPAIGTGNHIQGGHPAFSSAQQAVVQLKGDGTAADPLPGPAGAPAAPVTEVGTPPTAEPQPVTVDLSPLADWLELARSAKRKMEVQKDVYDQAMNQVNDYLDQQGGVDISKVGHIGGIQQVTRTFIPRRNFKKEKLLADHPEIDPEVYTDVTTYYRTELK